MLCKNEISVLEVELQLKIKREGVGNIGGLHKTNYYKTNPPHSWLPPPFLVKISDPPITAIFEIGEGFGLWSSNIRCKSNVIQ